MTESNRSTILSAITRRRLIFVAALAPIVPVATVLAGQLPDAPGMTTPAPRLDDPLPTAMTHWRNDHGKTFSDLFSMMVTEAECATFFPDAYLAVEQAASKVREWPTDARLSDLDTAQVRYAAVATDQALRLGYALAMTRDHAEAGIDAWYTAALGYAGIRPMTPAESAAAFDRMNQFNHDEARRRGWLPNEGTVIEPTSQDRTLALLHELAARLTTLEELS